MNSVTLSGSLVKDPELKDRGQHKICELRIAESGGRKDSPLYINVSAYGRTAETCQQYLSKGRQVGVTGQLRFREWQAEDGSKRSEHSIAADRVDFLASPSKGRGKGGGRGGNGGSPPNGGGGGRRPEGANAGGSGGGDFEAGGGFEEGAGAYGGGEEGGF